MRSVALFFVIFAFSAIDVLCINWDDPESQTVDEMFAGDYGSVYGSLQFPLTPQASRAEQAGEPNKEIINLPIGANHSIAAAISQQTENREQSQIIAVQPVVTNAAAQIQSRPTSASGTWQMEMVGDTSRNATLTLFQSGDTVFGKGEIKEDYNTTLATTASGIAAVDKLTLDLVTLEKMSLYRLSLTVSGDLVAGSYTEFNTDEGPLTGTIKGMRTISQS